LRTAFYNYLFAKKNNGKLILRIEDTDSSRFVSGAEEYIQQAFDWLGIEFDESPSKGGPYGPYKQSERKDIYEQYYNELIDNGKAYLDVSVKYDDLETACYVGIINDQKAIYDNANAVAIHLPTPQRFGTMTQQRTYNHMAAEQTADAYSQNTN
jgi:glutamyl/glutaminyl-tRNA synthetase